MVVGIGDAKTELEGVTMDLVVAETTLVTNEAVSCTELWGGTLGTE